MYVDVCVDISTNGHTTRGGENERGRERERKRERKKERKSTLSRHMSIHATGREGQHAHARRLVFCNDVVGFKNARASLLI
jgi:hypothetical protein